MPSIEAAPIDLIGELRFARAESDRLFKTIKSSATYERPIDARHRIVFYIGHLEAFDAIQISRQGLGLKPDDAELDNLFQAGIDPDSSSLPTDQPHDWPSLEQVYAYVERCRSRVDAHLEHVSEEMEYMLVEHRFMHIETLAYMFHNLPYEMKETPRQSAARMPSPATFKTEWREIPAGEAILGKQRDGSFGWDNEYEQVIRHVPAFRIQHHSVTNGEYLLFVNEGAPMPHFWVRHGNDVCYRGMFEEIPLPLDWPVYVTQAEAQAYARWLGKSLPTEEQFHRAAFSTPEGGHRPFPWGGAVPAHEHGNFHFQRWDPESVFATPAGDSAFGVSQLVGNGWEWTHTLFGPLPGFKADERYPGYSANFFDDQHYVLKGGSPRTAALLLRRSFRNWFRSDYPFVYAKFRCVEN